MAEQGSPYIDCPGSIFAPDIKCYDDDCLASGCRIIRKQNEDNNPQNKQVTTEESE